MLINIVAWCVFLIAGILLQRAAHEPRRLSHILFVVTFWGLSPGVTFFAYASVDAKNLRQLVLALPLVIAASWITLGVGVLWARMGSREPRTQGLFALAAGFGNTANVGYPLATLLFGSQGLALAVIYSEFQFLIPTLAVAVGVARRFAGPETRAPATHGLLAMLRSWFINPPVAAGALAVILRVSGLDVGAPLEPVGPWLGVVVGSFGFMQVGVALPLKRLELGLADAGRAAVTIGIRCGVGPLVLFTLSAVLGVSVPPVYLLLAAMPVAFMTLALTRVYDLDAEFSRLLIAVSTPLVIAGALVWHVL